MDDDGKVVLNILKNGSTEVTPLELVEKAKESGVKRPLLVIKELITKELVRSDPGKNGRPDRIKITNKAW